MSKLNVIDLFCGCGGLSIGLEQTGFTVAAGVDLDEDSIETFAQAHPAAKPLCMDVREFIDQSSRYVRLNSSIDVLVGGPPCQGFSAINPSRTVSDPRNSCVDIFLNAVTKLNPKVVVIENVTGLLSLGEGTALDGISEQLVSDGYVVSAKILQAAHYGAPQSRWRLFIVGSRKGSFEFPKPTHRAPIRPNIARGRELTFKIQSEPTLFEEYRDPVTIRDAISDLPPLANGGGERVAKYAKKPETDFQERLRNGTAKLFNHQAMNLGKIQIARVKAIPEQGMNWRNLPTELIPKNLQRLHKKFGNGMGCQNLFGRLRWDGFFTTILTKPELYWGSYIHPDQDRVLSVREAARAQTFPDRVRFAGNLSSQYRQVGNAVPPVLGEALGKAIREHLQR